VPKEIIKSYISVTRNITNVIIYIVFFSLFLQNDAPLLDLMISMENFGLLQLKKIDVGED
jgi:hypothetical protein